MYFSNRELKGTKCMKIMKEKTWQHETTGVDGNANLFDVNIFDYIWEGTNKSAKVHDP